LGSHHPTGKPINHSVQRGFDTPLAHSDRGTGVRTPLCDSFKDERRMSGGGPVGAILTADSSVGRHTSRLLPLMYPVPPAAVGVGHSKQPRPKVGSTDGGSRKHSPFRIVPQVGQVPENTGQSPAGQVPDVLHDDEEGS
jgi:hypothetical protein